MRNYELKEIFNSKFGLSVTTESDDGHIISYAAYNASERAEFNKWWALLPNKTIEKVYKNYGIYKN